MMNSSWIRSFSPEPDSSLSIDDDLSTESKEKVYAYRPPIPQSAEEVSEVLLDKLEQAGRVPSKEKFRRMACNVRFFIYCFLSPLIHVHSLRPLFTPVAVLIMIVVSVFLSLLSCFQFDF
jgi:hypothetical protein